MTWRNLEPDARALVAWADQKFADRLVMTSAFGLNGVALIHLVYEVCRLEVPVVFVDTGYLFPETLDTRDRVAARYGLVLYETRARRTDLPEPPDEACCQARKVEPMRQALDYLHAQAVLSGRGRFQAVTRRRLMPVEWGTAPLRVNPLVHWGQAEIEEYVQFHGIPYNPLYDAGYYSVGCVPCTRAVKTGEDVRSGRWDGLGRVECGLWTNGENEEPRGQSVNDWLRQIGIPDERA